MAISARFAADFSEFYAACIRADVELKTMDAGAAGVEKSLNKLANSLSGTKMLQDAHLMTEAVDRIGGASALTRAEQEKVNRTLTEAIAKYDALGRSAPAEMQLLAAQTRKIDDETKKVTTSAINWKSTLTSLAGAVGISFSVGAVVAFGKHVFDAASEIHDMAEKLGISTDAVQGFKFAAEQSGSTLDNVGIAINKMNDNLSGGNEATVAALNAAGLKFQDIRNMKPEDAFLAIADAIQKMPDPMQQADVAMALFGKSAASLLPGIKEGFRATANAADKMSKETIDSLEKAQDAWQHLFDKVTIVSGGIIAATMKTATQATASWKDFFAYAAGLALGMRSFDLAPKPRALDINLPAPGVIHKTAEELAAIKAAAKKAAAEAAKYAAVVAEIHAATVPLTVTQKAQIRTLETLGVSVGTIAKYLHLTEAPIGKFNDDLKETAKSIDQIGKMVASIPHNVPLRLVTEGFSGAVPMIDVKAVQAASEGVKQIHAATFDEIESRMRTYGVLSQDVLTRNAAVAREQYNSMRASGLFTADELQKAWAKAQAATDAAIGKTGGLFGSLMTSLQQLPQLLVSAFTGGGGLKGAMEGMGVLLGGTLGKSIGSGIKALGKFGGPIGEAIGALAGPLIGKIVGMFSSAGRDAVKAFATEMTGSDDLNQLHAYLQKNLSGEESEHFWKLLTQGTDRHNPQQAAANIQLVIDAIAKHKDAIDATGTAATAAGDAQVEAAKKAQAAVDEMTGKIKSLTDSIKDEAPEEVMGIVEANTRAQIAAIEAQRDAAQAAIDQTTTSAADAAQAAGDIIDTALKTREYRIRVKVDLDGLPGGATSGTGSFPSFAGGTQGQYLNFGPGTLAMLHGREKVVTEGEDSGVGGEIHVYIGNEQLEGRMVRVARKDAARGGLRPRAAHGRSY